ncbi:acetolactate synthase [Sporosarcina sp. P21c]|uniref:thiamine pyrophosphate-binding protein n=1 Tax=unclassified Sporosarcina TaxID=2647733 RepID=UPI000C1628A5|nr:MULTISPECIES: thiamine pyrophosphate-binding protein [unclassified Sporosarcina]PIC67462.1 acetolactate synthase [Sporosarcina sp. P16a]PIC89717.1 acetolactate synthase [Sporosarcina sp. P21c]PIC92913.1 acetolactate synthase [Sporosarcina sp. P25]
MKAVRGVLEYLMASGVQHVFGIPAGSVNAFFDELYEIPELTPIVTKHEGAASYMAVAYAKYTASMSVCIGCSGPGGTNLLTGAANAMREHVPVLFLTGAVPVDTVGLNASQELNAEPLFKSVTKYSVTVTDSNDLLGEVAKACEIAISGVPGPVHIAMPIDIQINPIESPEIPAPPKRTPIVPDQNIIQSVARELASKQDGYIFVGQGIRNSVDPLLKLAEMLEWPIITTPQAKGYIVDDHPLHAGVFGFAGHDSASSLINGSNGEALLVVGSSLGETATNNWNVNLTKDRYTIQLDYDSSVFNRKYEVDAAVLGDIDLSLTALLDELKTLNLPTKDQAFTKQEIGRADSEEYNTKNVLMRLQKYAPRNTRYTIDIGEFMAYIIHDMNVLESDTFDINVHFGAMGSGIGSAIGSKLAEPERPVVCVTGDGCFFMHGMEILTAKEHRLPIVFVVMNNARLGMVYHGHSLQYKRSHPSFEQEPVNIAAMAAAMNIPSKRIEKMEDLTQEVIDELMNVNGPSVLEIYLIDNTIPPMGDRVKFLSSFGK